VLKRQINTLEKPGDVIAAAIGKVLRIANHHLCEFFENIVG
jgi:hypothetical protein